MPSALAVIALTPFGEGIERLAVCALPSLLLVLCAASADVPRLKPLRISGDISYPLYLSHPFVLSAFAQVWNWAEMEKGPAFFVVGLCAAEAGAWLCWRFVEVPLTRWARHMTDQRVVPVSLRV